VKSSRTTVQYSIISRSIDICRSVTTVLLLFSNQKRFEILSWIVRCICLSFRCSTYTLKWTRGNSCLTSEISVLSYAVLLTIRNSHNITIFGATKTFPRVLRTRLCPRRRLRLYCAVNRNWLTRRDDVTRSLARVPPKVNACKRYMFTRVSYENSRCNNMRGVMICFVGVWFLSRAADYLSRFRTNFNFEMLVEKKNPIISGSTRPKGIVYNGVFYSLSTKCPQKFRTKKHGLLHSLERETIYKHKLSYFLK